MASRRSEHLALSGLLVLLCIVLPGVMRAQVAVVVNRANPVASLTLEQLRRLYLGTSTTFPGGGRVTLVESPLLRAGFYHQLFGMTQDEFKRHWVGVVFSGEDATPPKEIAHVPELRHFVARQPGAIAFLALADADTSVKVLAIGGVKPGDVKYPLRTVAVNNDKKLVRLLDAIETPIAPVVP